ncbi:Uu.00g005750.m01.CDS01 [Anthostomella pinea]|uniref:Uu.00g005750.m01.CDS01 n=1 Tax=Anthostomella pinea TaxID=933095 RepID=A0AAI8VLC1_9PEZI|nr:Uu.00g005750.m01.CDS01 [Anthostomella pinea]
MNTEDLTLLAVDSTLVLQNQPTRALLQLRSTHAQDPHSSLDHEHARGPQLAMSPQLRVLEVRRVLHRAPSSGRARAQEASAVALPTIQLVHQVPRRPRLHDDRDGLAEPPLLLLPARPERAAPAGLVQLAARRACLRAPRRRGTRARRSTSLMRTDLLRVVFRGEQRVFGEAGHGVRPGFLGVV